mgnify:CR=1 FL=1
MRIQPDASMTVTEGDFGDVGNDHELHVAPGVFGLLQTLGARTAESLYDQAAENPELIADALNWSADEIAAAVVDLRAEIARVRPGYFDTELAPTERFGRGALPPRSAHTDDSSG